MKSELTEKQKLEKIAAEKFLLLFNEQIKENYVIKELSDSPDIICENSDKKKIFLEITHIEDRNGDIAALLGRSNSRDLEVVKKRPLKVSDYSPSKGKLLERIKEKNNHDYGENVALVIRDTSPLDWDWTDIINEIKDNGDLNKIIFDLGIWILNYDMNKISRVI